MTNLPDRLTELELALTALAEALATGRPDAVLAAEAPLADAVRRLAAADPASANRRDIWAGVLAVRQALGRVRLLGTVSASLQLATELQPAYTVGGRAASIGRTTIEARI